MAHALAVVREDMGSQGMAAELDLLRAFYSVQQPLVARLMRVAIPMVQTVGEFSEKAIKEPDIRHLIAREFFQALRGVERQT